MACGQSNSADGKMTVSDEFGVQRVSVLPTDWEIHPAGQFKKFNSVECEGQLATWF